ncbi:serine hydrolase [Streptomyces sp. NPDC047980]|uniref:serine hydrolase n=1 Tax=Streptomyces sp. NPDC047980 TaxID=3365494 RepID=UPI003717D632
MGGRSFTGRHHSGGTHRSAVPLGSSRVICDGAPATLPYGTDNASPARSRHGGGARRLPGGPTSRYVLGHRPAQDVALGLWLSGPNGSYGPNPRAAGHDGFGGSCGLADPEAELSMGYVMNRMGSRIADDPRKMALVEAVYGAL